MIAHDADKDFLYTDWNFTVEEVMKTNGNSPVYRGATILVTRPGGKLQVNGRTVYATCGIFWICNRDRNTYFICVTFPRQAHTRAEAGEHSRFLR